MHKRMWQLQALQKILKEEKKNDLCARLFGVSIGLGGGLNLFNNLLHKQKEVGNNAD